MIIFVISSIFAVFSLQFFVINLQIQSLNRLIINTPISLFSKAVYDLNDDLYFDVYLLEETLNDYYVNEITKYTNKYEISYYFYNLEDHSYCTLNFCKGVDITISCSLINNYHFSLTMYYEARDGRYG